MNLKEFLEKIARNKSSRKVVKFAYICNVTSLRSLMLYWKFQLQGKHSLPNIAWHNKIILTIVVCVCKCIWKLLIWIYTLEFSRVKGHTIYIYMDIYVMIHCHAWTTALKALWSLLGLWRWKLDILVMSVRAYKRVFLIYAKDTWSHVI